jgi:hypothetical protein
VALEAVAYIGGLLARLAQNGIHAARRKFTNRNNDALASIFRDGEIVHAIQIRERLPELLASDLRDYQERNPATRFVGAAFSPHQVRAWRAYVSPWRWPIRFPLDPF